MAELGKRERLRSGEAVELKSGVFGRLNKENRTLELDSGKVLPISEQDQRDLFPGNEADLDVARRTEKLEGQVKKAPFGEFLHQFGSQGLANAPKDWLDYFTQTGDQYLRQKEAEGRVSSRISQESPFTSGAATVASFVPDIALAGGMSATKAEPLLTGLHAGSRIVSEPEEVAKEALIAGGAGKIIDMGANALNKIAQRRGEIRSLPGKQAAVREQNVLGQQAVNEANALQAQEFNALQKEVKGINEARLEQHQTDLNTRQNKMIEDQNAFESARAARDAEVIRLKNAAEMSKAQRSVDQSARESEYKIAKDAADAENKRFAEQFKLEQSQHQQALKELPELQRKAQQEYSENVVKNAQLISKSFPKDSRIYSSQFSTNQFIDEAINKSALAGTREASQASRILKSIMPDGEILTSTELANRYKALEGAIQKSSPEVASVLNEFKSSMGDKLNTILADNMAYTRVMPSLQKQITKEIESTLNSMGLAESGLISRSMLKRKAQDNMNRLFRELTPQDFINKFQSGEIREQILRATLRPEDFAVNMAPLNAGKRSARMSSEDAARLGIQLPPDPSKLKYDEFSNLMSSKLDKAIAKAELKMIAVDVDATTKLGNKVKKTLGMAKPITPPQAPIAPEPIAPPMVPGELPPVPPVQLPHPVAAPATPPLPSKPNLSPMPAQPTPQTFQALAETNLAPAQVGYEMAGDLLEKKLLGGKTLTNNPLTKLAGLRYALGKAALPLEAAYGGMKALTSPTAMGQAARMTFKQGGIQAVLSWAEKYPSYQNGILQNPQERRSFTKEIEDDPEIPLEQKAIIQSKVNRGKQLTQSL